jgi:malonate transporter
VIAVLGLVAPVFLLIALGYAAGVRRVLSDEAMKGINDFAYWLCAPALLFVSAASGGAAAHGGRLELAYFAGALTVFGVALLLSRLVAGRNLAESGLFSLVMLPLTTIVAEMGMSAGASPMRVLRTTLHSVVRNPVVMAVVAGNLWAILLPAPPLFLQRFLEILGGGTSPLLLFCLGASLRDFQIRRDWVDALVITFFKLLVLPLLVFGLGQLAGLPPLDLAVAVILASMPTGANAFLMSRRYAIGMERSGAAVLLGTMISVVTLTLVLGWVTTFGVARP